MSGAHGHGEADHEGEAHAHPAPGLPEIRDEAANTPGWMPVLGIVLLVGFLATIFLTSKLAPGGDEPAGEATSERAAVEGPPGEAPTPPPAPPEGH